METVENDYYKILGVPENADEETIKKAYRIKAKKYHPDMNSNNIEAERKFREAGEAYAILGDPNKRKEYDLSRHKKSGITLSATNILNKEMENIFHSIFGLSYFDIQKNIKNNEKAYDEYMQFLNELEEKLKNYGKSVSNIIKKLEGRRGRITSNEIQLQKEGLLREYVQIEKNAEAFDAFQEFYKTFKEKHYALTSERWNDMKAYCDKENRCKYTPDELAKLKKKMENRYAEKLQEKTQNLLLLEEKLQRRNIELDSYLGKRQKNGVALTKENVTTYQLSQMLESMDLMDEIDTYLLPLEKTIGEYLKSCGKDLEEIKRNELQAIRDGLKKYIKHHKGLGIKAISGPIEDVLKSLKKEKENNLKELQDKLQKRNLNLETYLAKRKRNDGVILTPLNAYVWEIELMLESMKLMDEIDSYLVSLNITIEDYLKSRGKTLEEIKRKELQVIRDTLKEHSENHKNIMEENLEESTESKSIA